MKHLAAYLLLGLGGNTSPSASDIKSVLDSVGIEADDDRLETLLKELKGKDINEVQQDGKRESWTIKYGSLTCWLVAHHRGLFQARFRPVRWRWWRPCCWRCRCWRWRRRGTQGGGEKGRGYE